jgi:hypothetical protein
MLCACLRGEVPFWPRSAPPEWEARFVDRARFHRAHVLVHDLLSAPDAPPWPVAVVERLAGFARAEAVGEMVRSHELARVLDALADGGVRGVLMKGAALAHTVYASPSARPRVDSDLLIPEARRELAEHLLVPLGYTRAPRIAGSLVEYQAPYYRDDVSGQRCVVDLHWRVANRQVLASRLRFDDLAARSVAIPALCANARALDPVDALLVAALHGPAHHRGQDWPLVWSFDVHLLASGFAPGDWSSLVTRARRCAVRRLALAALVAARGRFGTPLPAAIADELAAAGREASAGLLRGRGQGYLWEDLRALPGWGPKLRLLREMALPDAAYLRARYGVRGRARLPIVAAHRVVRGLRRLGLGR